MLTSYGGADGEAGYVFVHVFHNRVLKTTDIIPFCLIRPPSIKKYTQKEACESATLTSLKPLRGFPSNLRLLLTEHSIQYLISLY